MNFIVSIDVGMRLKPISITSAAKLGLLDSVPISDHYKSFHLVIQDGKVFSAGKAIPILVELLLNAGWLSGLIARSKRLRNIIERIYELSAKAKHKSNCGQACPPKVDALH